MNEYGQRKLEYYGQPINLIEKHCHVILWILIALSTVTLLLDIFAGQAAWLNIDTGLRVLYVILMGFSVLTFSLLDKAAFYINIICCGFVGVWKVTVTIMSVVSMFQAATTVNKVFGDAGSSLGAVGGIIQGGASIAAGSLMIGTIIGAIINLTVISYFIVVIVQFIRHKKLFFSSLKQLKREYTEA